MATATFEVTIGRLMCRNFRDMVSIHQFKGAQLDIWESSGLIERHFVVRGPEQDVRAVEAHWRRFTEDLERREA